MTALVARLRATFAERDWLTGLVSIAGLIAIGILLGYQYMEPDKRVLGVLAAIVVLGIAWRIDLVSGLGMLVMMLPFPRNVSFGSTNLAFILLLLLVWLLRYTQRDAAAPRRTPLDAALAGMVLAYVLSFYNVDRAFSFQRGVTIFMLFLGCVMMFYLITSNVRTEAHLRRFHLFQVAGTSVIYAFCLWELAFPGHELIPGWIDFRGIGVEMVATKNYRVGGPWIDYELLSEFAAMNVIFFLFLLSQARSGARRVVFSTLLFVSGLVLFATVTRGGILALSAGVAYLLYLIRRRVNIVPLTIIGVSLAVLVWVLNYYVKNFTVAGDLFARLGETKFRGVIPDSRAEIWPQAWERWMEHPLIGHGPFYSAEHGLKLWFWPHDLPLFIGNCFGFLGLGFFLAIMWGFWKLSRPQTDNLADPDYVKAFTLAARIQLVIFFVDETKIEYLRNGVYQFMPWVFFSTLVAAGMIGRGGTEPVGAVSPSRPSRIASLRPVGSG